MNHLLEKSEVFLTPMGCTVPVTLSSSSVSSSSVHMCLNRQLCSPLCGLLSGRTPQLSAVVTNPLWHLTMLSVQGRVMKRRQLSIISSLSLLCCYGLLRPGGESSQCGTATHEPSHMWLIRSTILWLCSSRSRYQPLWSTQSWCQVLACGLVGTMQTA